MKQIFLALLFTSFLSACSSFSLNSPKIKNTTIYPLNNAPVIGKTFSNQPIKLGGFSSIHFFDKRDDNFYFYAITDRGPTAKTKNGELVFLIPDLNPKIKILKADKKTQEIEISAEIPLKAEQQKNITGLPTNRKEENPVDVFGLFYSIDPNGLDVRAISSDNEGGWWLADQYAPSLVQINTEGMLTKKLMANYGLPRMYTNKIPHKGFSAMARIDSRLFAFIPNFENLEDPISKDLYRILEASSDSMKTTDEYFYKIENPENKITAASALDSNKILVLEKSNDELFRKIFLIEINKSEEIVKKHLLLDLNLSPIKNLQDINGLTIVDKKTIALITDNHFQVAGETDLKTGLTPMNDKLSQLVVFEFEKDIIR